MTTYFDKLPMRLQRELCQVLKESKPYIERAATSNGVTPRNVVQSMAATGYSRGVTGAGRGRPASFRVHYEASLHVSPAIEGASSPVWEQFKRVATTEGQAYYPDLEAILSEWCSHHGATGLDLSTLRRSKSNIYSRGVMGCNCRGALPDGKHIWLRIDISKSQC